MGEGTNPYDELEYRSRPIACTAPERLALVSLLEGGPRARLDQYRVLELGCGSGANLLPLAFYRPRSTFVGLDGARSQIELGEARRVAAGVDNLQLIHSDFATAFDELPGKFDYIIAHGVFSWVDRGSRDALLQIFSEKLLPGGLVYLNYNSRPGWNVRGLVRDFLLAQTKMEGSLRARAELARETAVALIPALDGAQHPYVLLMANELKFVGEGELSWIAHEYLCADNHPYWHSEFIELAGRHGLKYVADAGVHDASNLASTELEQREPRLSIDAMDLFSYRQLRAPILTLDPFERNPPTPTELGALTVASSLEASPAEPGANTVFRHASGYEVETKDEDMRTALERLRAIWPNGCVIRALYPEVSRFAEDLLLLHRNGLIELRCREPADSNVAAERLKRLELEWGGYFTTPDHRWERG